MRKGVKALKRDKCNFFYDLYITMSKKDNNSNNDISSIMNNAGTFLITLLVLTFVVCFHFSFGGFILFACKVAQANILPTDIRCSPYTENPIDIKPVTSNIFVAKPPHSQEYLSQKIKFPYQGVNSQNTIIDTLRSLKESPDSFFLTNYFYTILESLLSFNYYAYNLFFGSLNSFLGESFILILGPLLFPIVFSILLVCNNLYLIFLWFEKMGWFFKKNIYNVYEGRRPEWRNISIFEPISYFLAFCFVFFFFLLFFVMCWTAFPILSLFVVFWTALSFVGYQGAMEAKEVSVAAIIMKVFKYHKVTFMSILTFLIIVSAFINMGGAGGMICVFVAICIYFGVVPSNIFIPEIPLHLSELVSNDQAKKTCKVPKFATRRHSFLYNLLFPQRGGAELVNEIKKIGKKMKGG
jgi:hypothetical protein